MKVLISLIRIQIFSFFSDRVEEADVDVQTDAFLDRPPSPLFIPSKTGIDQATQVLDGDVCVVFFYLKNCFVNFLFLF